ncbi:hypothetical protein BGX34_001987, partial [Mortierella sp. NVP85]
MEVTQSFRLTGEADIIEIPCDYVDGQYVVHWADIEQIFPGVKYVKRGNVAVIFMKDPNLTRSIKHYLDVVLEVVLSISNRNEPTAAAQPINRTDASSDIVESLQVASVGDAFNSANQRQSPPSDVKEDAETVMSLKQVVERVQTLSMESRFELVSSRSSDFQVQARTSTYTLESLVQKIGNGLVNRSDKQLAALHELKDNVMDIKDKASMILELVFENKELTTRVLELQEE